MLFMWVVVIIFLCFYLYFRFRNKPLDFPPRFLRTLEDPEIPHRTCYSNTDCHDSNEICYRGVCRPRLVRGGECDPATGDWTLTERNGRTRVACTCRYPDFFDQNIPGGNCNVDRVCGPIGRLKKRTAASLDGTSDLTWECECPDDTVSKRNFLDGKPYCAKMTVADRKVEGPCRDDELDVLNPVDAQYLKSSYTNRFPNIRCFKTPCTFDALTNKPLNHVQYIRNYGCICNPRRGNVGVHIENHPDYVNVLGYNACVNIFENGEPPHDWPDVTLYTYFYLFDKKPVSFTVFSNLRSEAVAQPFREALSGNDPNKALQIEEVWPYDYVQDILRNDGRFVTRLPITYACNNPEGGLYQNPNKCQENYNSHYRIKNCKEVFNKFIHNPMVAFFNYPICRVEPGDVENTKVYDHKIISNPLHVTSPDLIPVSQLTKLSNGIQLKPFDSERWSVDFAPTNSDYLEIGTNTIVPNYDAIFRKT